jgi:hypothetical protein
MYLARIEASGAPPHGVHVQILSSANQFKSIVYGEDARRDVPVLYRKRVADIAPPSSVASKEVQNRDLQVFVFQSCTYNAPTVVSTAWTQLSCVNATSEKPRRISSDRAWPVIGVVRVEIPSVDEAAGKYIADAEARDLSQESYNRTRILSFDGDREELAIG